SPSEGRAWGRVSFLVGPIGRVGPGPLWSKGAPRRQPGRRPRGLPGPKPRDRLATRRPGQASCADPAPSADGTKQGDVPGNLVDRWGRVVTVRGGNGGMGRGMARGLAEGGARMVVVGRNAEKSADAARRIAEETKVETLAVSADVSAEADCRRIADEARSRF